MLIDENVVSLQSIGSISKLSTQSYVFKDIYRGIYFYEKNWKMYNILFIFLSAIGVLGSACEFR